jgi:hypothetical protein
VPLGRRADGGNLYCNANMKPVEPTKVLIRGRNLNTNANNARNGSKKRKSMLITFIQQAVSTVQQTSQDL